MSTAVEIAITITDESNTLKKDFLCYEPLLLDTTHPPLSDYLRQTEEEFKGNLQEAKVSVRATTHLYALGSK